MRRYIPQDVKRAVMQRDFYTCQSCGSLDYPEVDHIISFSAGGDNSTSNLQVLCRKCNSVKSNRVYREHISGYRPQDEW